MASIARFDPFDDAVGNLFRAYLRPTANRQDQAGIKMDIYETEDAYLISADIPGARKEDIQVSIYENQLTVNAEIRIEQEAGKKVEWLLRERNVGKVTRTIVLPLEIDDDNAQARHENGVLHLALPKRPASMAKKLTIN